ncbi:hypothetical protein EYF80_067383 [Liparis tanakae]|uniref:Uncharacterized protein n=1 Tax=Liparis tanakae TaxID=230148 RepID=A0A4Z2E166_9TELE|nr:hypothetical protein EYF80_067383 [Liparis tanakae]
MSTLQGCSPPSRYSCLISDSTRLIHWKLSSSVESGRCSATTTILSSLSTVTEKTAILGGRRRTGGGKEDTPPRTHS